MVVKKNMEKIIVASAVVGVIAAASGYMMSSCL